MRAKTAGGGIPATPSDIECQEGRRGVDALVWSCPSCQADVSAGCTKLRAECRVDAELVIYRLEEAGSTLLALPHAGHSTRMVQGGLEWVRTAKELDAMKARMRPARVTANAVSRMDEALSWVLLIPPDRYVLRRILHARCLVNPVSGRFVYSWRRVALAVGCDHKAAQRWHAQAVDMIVAALCR